MNLVTYLAKAAKEYYSERAIIKAAYENYAKKIKKIKDSLAETSGRHYFLGILYDTAKNRIKPEEIITHMEVDIFLLRDVYLTTLKAFVRNSKQKFEGAEETIKDFEAQIRQMDINIRLLTKPQKSV